jgi:hypothetical protein
MAPAQAGVNQTREEPKTAKKRSKKRRRKPISPLLATKIFRTKPTEPTASRPCPEVLRQMVAK